MVRWFQLFCLMVIKAKNPCLHFHIHRKIYPRFFCLCACLAIFGNDEAMLNRKFIKKQYLGLASCQFAGLFALVYQFWIYFINHEWVNKVRSKYNIKKIIYQRLMCCCKKHQITLELSLLNLLSIELKKLNFL